MESSTVCLGSLVDAVLADRLFRDLFIRSLLAMHDAPASDPFSYFQISG